MYRTTSIVAAFCAICFAGAVDANAVAISAQAQIYWTDTSGWDTMGSSIKRANGDGSNITILCSGFSHLRGMAVDAQGGKMYWTSYDHTTPVFADYIKRANLDGSGVENLVGIGGGGGGVALDVQGGKMYWTDSEGSSINGRILRANLDGTLVETLVAGLLHPGGGIALDVQDGKVYWMDVATHKIQRANLNGSGVEDFLTGIPESSGLAIDVSEGKLYWTEWVTKKIQCANLDGSGLTDLVTGLNLPTGLGLDLSEGKMYWTETDGNNSSNSYIQRANLNGSNVETILPGLSGVGAPWGIAVASVPEPSTLVLLGIGAIGLLAYAWRRRR